MPKEKKTGWYFKFSPGDYLRDTQCLNEKAQVAYDRIMCEHMRNICISQQQHKFFTKRLNEDELFELNNVLKITEEGYQIEWVAKSILDARAYSESRSGNRNGKKKKKEEKDMSTYVEHMDSYNYSYSNNNIDINIKKEKKEAKKEFAPGITLTTSEDEKLKAEFGIVITQAAYLFLSSYKAEKGYKTKSDNLTIRRWVIDAVKKQANGTQQNNGCPPNGVEAAGPKLGTSAARINAIEKWGNAALGRVNGE